MKRIVIIGAGGLGRIVYDVLLNDNSLREQFSLGGFLDTRADLTLPLEIKAPILGSPLTYQPEPEDIFIPAVGNPGLRRDLVVPLLNKGAEFFSYTHTAAVGARTQIGTGVFLTPGVVVSTDCTIGAFGYIDTYSVIGHNVNIGEHCMIGAMSFLAGGVQVGKCVAIHPRATIAKDVRIGDGATIGLGSVVLKNVPTGATVFGNPARIISITETQP